MWVCSRVVNPNSPSWGASCSWSAPVVPTEYLQACRCQQAADRRRQHAHWAARHGPQGVQGRVGPAGVQRKLWCSYRPQDAICRPLNLPCLRLAQGAACTAEPHLPAARLLWSARVLGARMHRWLVSCLRMEKRKLSLCCPLVPLSRAKGGFHPLGGTTHPIPYLHRGTGCQQSSAVDSAAASGNSHMRCEHVNRHARHTCTCH